MRMYNILTLKFDMGKDLIEVHPLLIQEGEELILCDAGYPNQLQQIELELKRCGFTMRDLTKIFISHHDHDHIGSIGQLKENNPSVEIITSEIEKPFVEGTEKSLRLIQAEEYNESLNEEEKEFGEAFANYLKTINSVKVNTIVGDGDYIAKGVKVVSTPGHTPGHQSILLESESILFTGDALAFENNRLIIANPEFTLDIDECMKSIRKISDMKLSKLICYHGGLVENGISESLSELLENE
ncbi:MBL fold metallo-hydrolase [Orenia metallireducens]|nr:MBL fold metallo-hydrolase [Orenia metallireducens]